MDNTILYNEETTAEDLNNIAIELGNTDFSVFSDGETYAVTKLNEITSSLVSKGVLSSKNRCFPSLSDGILEIADGIIVFESGQKIKIEEPLQLPISETGTYYIYAVNEIEANSAKIEIYTEELISGDFVPICSVTDGVLTDRRIFSKASVPLSSYGASYKMHFEGTAYYEPASEVTLSIKGISKLFICSTNINGFFDTTTGLFTGIGWRANALGGVIAQYIENIEKPALIYNGSSGATTIFVKTIVPDETLTLQFFAPNYLESQRYSFDLYAFGGEV